VGSAPSNDRGCAGGVIAGSFELPVAARGAEGSGITARLGSATPATSGRWTAAPPATRSGPSSSRPIVASGAGVALLLAPSSAPSADDLSGGCGAACALAATGAGGITRRSDPARTACAGRRSGPEAACAPPVTNSGRATTWGPVAAADGIFLSGGTVAVACASRSGEKPACHAASAPSACFQRRGRASAAGTARGSSDTMRSRTVPAVGDAPPWARRAVADGASSRMPAPASSSGLTSRSGRSCS
jgi:hypothetical protein